MCFQVAHARWLGEYEEKHAGKGFERCYEDYTVQQERFSGADLKARFRAAAPERAYIAG